MQVLLLALGLSLAAVVPAVLAFIAYWQNLPVLLWASLYSFLLAPSGVCFALIVLRSVETRAKTAGWSPDGRVTLLKLMIKTSLPSFVVSLGLLTAIMFDVGNEPSGLTKSLMLTAVLGGVLLLGYLAALLVAKEDRVDMERLLPRNIDEIGSVLQGMSSAAAGLSVKIVRNPLTRRVQSVEAKTAHGTVRLRRQSRSRTWAQLLAADWRPLAEWFERTVGVV